MLQLSAGGSTRYKILVAAGATAQEQHAARELSSYLKQATGCEFPLVQQLSPENPVIAVGAGAAKLVDADLQLKDLGDEGILVRASKDNLILSGGENAARGTLYAVYTFLQDSVGIRWWAPDATFVPTREKFAITALDLRCKPVFEYRDPFIHGAFDADFAVRNKINGPYRKIDAARGGQIDYAGFVHTFYDLVPPKQHFEAHPEWYSEVSGKRTVDRAQLCLTNKELLVFVIKRVREWIVSNPEEWLRDRPPAKIVSVSQNDWLGQCECRDCRKVEDEEGSACGPLLRFVNAIAEDIEKDHPDVAIDTLAYMYSRKPTKLAKPRPNVIVRLCSIECSFLQPLDSEANKAFVDDLKSWSKICDRLYVWDYVVNYSHQLMPHPNLRVLGPNVRLFAAHHVRGVLEQGNHMSPGGEFTELKSWVLARLLWNPELQAEALIDEFLDGYYGSAAPKLREYIKLLHDRAAASGHYLGIQDDFGAPYLTVELLGKLDALLRAALAAVEKDAAQRQRVERLALATRYVFAARWPYLKREALISGTPWPLQASRDELIEEVQRVCEKNGITAFFEDWTEDKATQPEKLKRRHGGRTPPPRPAGFEDVPERDFIDLQDECAQLWSRPKKANWVEDASASDGKAAWLPGDDNAWNYNSPLTDPTLQPEFNAEWTAYAVIRVKRHGDAGNAFRCGTYDRNGKREIHALTVKCADIADEQYHVYKLGAFTPSAPHYFWASAAGNGANVEAVWVDRFFLVRGARIAP